MSGFMNAQEQRGEGSRALGRDGTQPLEVIWEVVSDEKSGEELLRAFEMIFSDETDGSSFMM